VTVCRTVDEVYAAALADAADDPPLTQEQADLIVAILWPYRHQLAMFRGLADEGIASDQVGSM
jgi:hypothetical protein